MNSNSSKVPACIYRSAVAALLFFSFFSTSYAENLTLAWDPNEEPDLGGYIVYRNIGSPGPPYRYSSHLPEDDLADPLNPTVTQLVRDALRNMGKIVAASKIVLLGASYREGVGDTRYSGSEVVVRKLTEMGADIVVHDPFVKPWWEL
jgi:hypothetical protein